MKVRILPFLTTFTQLTARLKNFLRGWLLVLSLKEGLVECATVCVKSEVILMCTLQSRTGPVQGQNRVFPVKFSTQGKTCFHYREPLFSLQGPLFSLQGFPCEKTSQGNPCFDSREWVCSAAPGSSTTLLMLL